MALFNAIGGLVGGLFGASQGRAAARSQERAAQLAAQTARLGFDYLTDSPIGTAFVPAGAQALDVQQALLGLGGDEAAAQEAYDNYLQSIGFQGQLQAGTDAITGSRAARGLLQSGRTGTALQEFGSQLGQQAFQNYLGNVNALTQTGLQAGSIIGGAGSAAGGVGAQAIQTGAGRAADYRLSGYRDLARGIGGVAGLFQPRG